jgi:hypothetical protein
MHCAYIFQGTFQRTIREAVQGSIQGIIQQQLGRRATEGALHSWEVERSCLGEFVMEQMRLTTWGVLDKVLQLLSGTQQIVLNRHCLLPGSAW